MSRGHHGEAPSDAAWLRAGVRMRPDGGGSPAPVGPEDPPRKVRAGVNAEGGHGAGGTDTPAGLS